jgi:ABC-type uncharacterized transport system permease subunit
MTGIAIAHSIAISLYLGAAALAATPFARPVSVPVRRVVTLLAAGVAVHGVALILWTWATGRAPINGLGPSLSLAGFVIAGTVLIVELLAREAAITLAAAPLAALATAAGNVVGMHPASPPAAQGLWLVSHVALSFAGIAAYTMAAAAGVLYLVEHRELKTRRFRALFRFFPPLHTLDRVNHLASLVGWLVLTLGIALAASYALTYRPMDAPKLVWGTVAWIGITVLALGRVVRGWQARRAALVASVTFLAVLALYIVTRLVVSGTGRFL